jgi:hypothetical protein
MSAKPVFKIQIQINHQPDATIFQFIILMFIYSSTCFGRFPSHHQELNDCSGSLWFYLRIVVIVLLCSWSGRLLKLLFGGGCSLAASPPPNSMKKEQQAFKTLFYFVSVIYNYPYFVINFQLLLQFLRFIRFFSRLTTFSINSLVTRCI